MNIKKERKTVMVKQRFIQTNFLQISSLDLCRISTKPKKYTAFNVHAG